MNMAIQTDRCKYCREIAQGDCDCEASIEIAQLKSSLRDAEHNLLIQTESARLLGRVAADKDADRLFFRNLAKQAEFRIDELTTMARDAVSENGQLTQRIAVLEQDARRSDQLFIDPNSAAFGHGTEFEEKVIAAGTRYITSTIGHYSTGDRRFTIGLYNSMLRAAIDAQIDAKKAGQHG